MKTIRVPARELKRGMTFVMFREDCFVVNAETNNLGQTYVRFVKGPATNNLISHLVVTRDYLFKTKT